jgi:uncharacterized protein YuzE
MRIRYDRESDVLVIDQGREGDRIDHAEELGPMIAHYNEQGRLILLEILDESEFVTAILQAIMRTEDREPVEVKA